jgi:hypothetical protein
MSQYGVYVQNVGRCGLGGSREGGNIATVRLAIHTHKPDIVILTEVSEKDSLIGKKGVFKGYTCTQSIRSKDWHRGRFYKKGRNCNC